MAPRPYTIEVPDAALDDLRERLGRTRWPEQIPVTGWDYGVDVAYLRELCEYWRDDYDWRRWEARLNELPGFRCEVDGVDLHYWHVRGVGPAPMPLMLVHGWPGSMMEFLELVGPLADPGAHGGDPADAFDVVVPALPGFGFGGTPRERGWGVSRIAAALHALMTRELGYERYAAQGGDWGSMISAKLGATYPEHVAGIHLNFILAPPPEDPGPEDADALERLGHWRATQSAYLQIQSTLPDSVTAAQSDSPAGLAAWIVEKFRRWSDCDGEVERAFSRDTLLTNLMFYWAPNSTPAAARIYYESARDPDGILRRPRVEVPVAYAAFPRESVRPPRHWVDPHYAITRWTEMPRGGHFAALEQPELLLGDVRVFLRTLR
jgi:pimeloyl-ACP methyl ester carboxylesterase